MLRIGFPAVLGFGVSISGKGIGKSNRRQFWTFGGYSGGVGGLIDSPRKIGWMGVDGLEGIGLGFCPVGNSGFF